MFHSADVRHERLRETLCFSIILWLRRFAKVGPKSEVVRRIGCPRCRQNLHHACARERFGSQNRKKLACSKHFWKLTLTKFAPRLRARAIRKSKSLKTGRPGALLEVDIDKICTTPARESDLEVKIVKNWRCRSTFGSWHRQNLHHACARERFGSQNR